MHSNHWHWTPDRRNWAFPDRPFKLERDSCSDGHLLYSVSHSMERAKDGVVSVYPGSNLGIATADSLEGAARGEETDAPDPSNVCTPTRPLQACALARDFPRDLLLIIFNYTLWFQLCDAESDDYVAHQALSYLDNHTSTHPTVLLSKRHSLLFLSFVCAHWRSVCLTTPTLWSNLHIHVWNQPFPEHDTRPPTNVKRCSADRARVSLCRLFLQRSGSAPLALSINADVSDTATIWLDMQVVRATDERMVLGRIFQMCVEHRERWVEVRVENLDDRFLFGLLFDIGEREGVDEHRVGFLALEKLSLGFNHVEEDGALFPRGDPDSTCRSWLEVRLHTLAGFVESLPHRYPGLRHLVITIDLIDVRLVPELIGACQSLFPPPDPEYVCSDERRRRAAEAHHAFKVWHGDFVGGLGVKGGEEPLYTGSLRKAWVRIVKDDDGIGLKDIDAGVDSLDWSSPLVVL